MLGILCYYFTYLPLVVDKKVVNKGPRYPLPFDIGCVLLAGALRWTQPVYHCCLHWKYKLNYKNGCVRFTELKSSTFSREDTGVIARSNYATIVICIRHVITVSDRNVIPFSSMKGNHNWPPSSLMWHLRTFWKRMSRMIKNTVTHNRLLRNLL